MAARSSQPSVPVPQRRVNARDCGWCGAVAMQGPFEIDGYDSEWYLCDYCAESDDGPAVTPRLSIERAGGDVCITVDGTVVVRYSAAVLAGAGQEGEQR